MIAFVKFMFLGFFLAHVFCEKTKYWGKQIQSTSFDRLEERSTMPTREGGVLLLAKRDPYHLDDPKSKETTSKSFFIILYDSGGRKSWTKKFVIQSFDIANDYSDNSFVMLDSCEDDEYFYIGGAMYSPPFELFHGQKVETQIWLSKLDKKDGTLVFDKRFIISTNHVPNDHYYAFDGLQIHLFSDSRVLISINAIDPIVNGKEIYLSMLRKEDFEMLWAKIYHNSPWLDYYFDGNTLVDPNRWTIRVFGWISSILPIGKQLYSTSKLFHYSMLDPETGDIVKTNYFTLNDTFQGYGWGIECRHDLFLSYMNHQEVLYGFVHNSVFKIIVSSDDDGEDVVEWCKGTKRYRRSHSKKDKWYFFPFAYRKSISFGGFAASSTGDSGIIIHGEVLPFTDWNENDDIRDLGIHFQLAMKDLEGRELFFLKLNAHGEFEWVRTFESVSVSDTFMFAKDDDNKVFISFSNENKAEDGKDGFRKVSVILMTVDAELCNNDRANNINNCGFEERETFYDLEETCTMARPSEEVISAMGVTSEDVKDIKTDFGEEKGVIRVSDISEFMYSEEFEERDICYYPPRTSQFWLYVVVGLLFCFVVFSFAILVVAFLMMRKRKKFLKRFELENDSLDEQTEEEDDDGTDFSEEETSEVGITTVSLDE